MRLYLFPSFTCKNASVQWLKYFACCVNFFVRTKRVGLGRPAACHLPGGPVGPPARWAATSNVEGGSGTEEGARSPLAMEGGVYVYRGPRVFSCATVPATDC